MKKCSCGELVEDHVRFHWTGPEEGHYADVQGAIEAHRVVVDNPVREELPGDWPVRFRRSAHLWGATLHRAPAPTLPVPSKPWGSEDELRKAVLGFLELNGFLTYDLEQGYRQEHDAGGRGGSRQTPGIGDAYFVHTTLGVQGWIETKRWDNEPTDDQRTFGGRVLQTGGIYLLVYELEQVKRWYRSLTRKAP